MPRTPLPRRPLSWTPLPWTPLPWTSLPGRASAGFHKMSRELQLCVVKTFSMMKTRTDHRNSSKDLENWKNKQKEGRQRKKKREMLAPTRTAPHLDCTHFFPGTPRPPPHPRAHPDRHQTTRQRTPTHHGGTRAGARVGRKSFFECRFEWIFVFFQVARWLPPELEDCMFAGLTCDSLGFGHSEPTYIDTGTDSCTRPLLVAHRVCVTFCAFVLCSFSICDRVHRHHFLITRRGESPGRSERTRSAKNQRYQTACGRNVV